MTVLELFQHRLAPGETLALPAAPRVVYSVERDEARFSTGPVTLERGHLLRYELSAAADQSSQLSAALRLNGDGEYLMRCDRVDLPERGIAYLHTHRGPGIRCLIEGRFRVDVDGGGQTIERYGAWFEAGPDPVEAHVVSAGPAAFVRVMILPRALLGERSIRYVRDEDRERPKPQRYRVFVDEPIAL